MDAVAQMLADLGVSRRDDISTATNDLEDFHAQSAMKREVAARRAQFSVGTAGTHGHDAKVSNSRDARLAAWNVDAMFERDAVAEQLPNRCDGQGHRSLLKQRLWGEQAYADEGNPRRGEERSQHFRRKSDQDHVVASFGHYANGRANKGGPRNSVETRLGPGNRQRHVANGATAPQPRKPAHTRAQSPRRAGTVRFGPGGRRIEANARAFEGLVNPGGQAAAAMRAAATKKAPIAVSPPKTPSVTSYPTPQPTTNPEKTPGADTLPEAKVETEVYVTRASSFTSATATSVRSTAQQPVIFPRASTTKATPTYDSASSIVTEVGATGAPAPAVDPSSNTPHGSYRAQMYRNMALWWAAHPGEECEAYYRNHPDRVRYLGPARDQLIKEAMSLAKNHNERDTSHYLELHKDRAWIVQSAKLAKSQVEDEDEDEIEAYCLVHTRHKCFIKAAKAIFLPKTRAMPVRVELTTTPAESPKIQRTDSVFAGACNTPRPTRKLGESSSSSSSDDEASIKTADTTPSPAKKLGVLTATFFDIAGACLGIQKYATAAPVRASVSFTSNKAGFNPLQLVQNIEALAQSMIDRSQGAGAHSGGNPNHILDQVGSAR